MTRTVEYWRNAWEIAKGDSSIEGDAGKTLSLLAQYAGFFKTLLSLPVAWGGTYGRFFAGRWDTQYGDQVEAAIGNFYLLEGNYRNRRDFHSVEFIVANIKDKIGDKPIRPDGNLAKILDLIKEKTGVDYHQLDANHIIQLYRCRVDNKASLTTMTPANFLKKCS